MLFGIWLLNMFQNEKKNSFLFRNATDIHGFDPLSNRQRRSTQFRKFSSL